MGDSNRGLPAQIAKLRRDVDDLKQQQAKVRSTVAAAIDEQNDAIQKLDEFVTECVRDIEKKIGQLDRLARLTARWVARRRAARARERATR